MQSTGPTDSNRQVVPAQPTAFVRSVVGIKRTRYVAIPPALADQLELRPRTPVIWKTAASGVLTLERLDRAQHAH